MNRPKQQIINAGQALLDLKLQNTHSGNISLKVGRRIYMTRTGSRKGHLVPADIIDFNVSDHLQAIPRISSEAGSHRGILEYSNAVIHSHSIAATLLSYFETQIIPVDWPGQFHLKSIPVLEFKSPAGSPEMEKKIPDMLRSHPALVVKTHGPFVRGVNLDEALFHMALLDFSATILLYLKSLGVNPSAMDISDYPTIKPLKILGQPKVVSDISIVKTITQIASDLFELQLSPLFTGSISLKREKQLLISPRATIPRYFKPVIYQVPLMAETDHFFIKLHQAVYLHSGARSAIFTHSPFGLIQAFSALSRGQKAIIPVDAEGKILYPSIPVLNPAEHFREIVKQAVRHKMVVLSGLGVLSIGDTLEQTIHHCSSLKNIGLIKTRYEMLKRDG